MDDSKQASFEFALDWQSQSGKYRERVFFSKLNLWRDFFPGNLCDQLGSLNPGESVTEEFHKGVIVEPFSKNRVLKVIKQKLSQEKLAKKGIILREGRFYPRSVLAGVGFTSQDTRPFRVLENGDQYLTIDINHPLCEFPISISGTMMEIYPQRSERGGSCNDIGFSLSSDGPGMQGDLPGIETRFFEDDPFHRNDEEPDQAFYQVPRLVSHIDQTAGDFISDIYERFVRPGMKVLDLMASWDSHLRIKSGQIDLTGLGLNKEELETNSLVSQGVVQDLNENSKLPFSDDTFDVVICTVSIEYLANPIEIVKEVGRVLKAGCPFVVTFSDRWFEPKAIKIWSELHSFERMGLVSSYFKLSGLFSKIQSESIRGYPRPNEDKYRDTRSESDPVFAVWGVKNSA